MDATDMRLGCLRGKDQHLMKPGEFIESRRRRERCYSWLLRHDAPAGSVLALPRSRHALLTTSANLAGEISLTRGQVKSTVGWASGPLFLIRSTSRLEPGAMLPCAS